MDRDQDRTTPPPPQVGYPEGASMYVTEDVDGPPLPPFVRRRRRRRTTLLLASAFVIVGVPLVWSVTSNGPASRDADTVDRAAPDEDEPAADPDTGSRGDAEAGEADAGEGEVDSITSPDALARPDPATLDGTDAVYAQLLADVDASELEMIGFSEAISATFEDLAAEGQEAITQRIRDVAAAGQRGLADVRDRLQEPLGDAGAETVRQAYVRHLDSWAAYMEAVENDPGILAAEERTEVFTLSINVTADTFARALAEALPADADEGVRELADGILDRGFRGFSDSNV